MLSLAPQLVIWVCVEPVDFRCGIDRLAQTCRTVLESDPMSGAVFVYRNRKATAVKILVYDGQGFWLAQKRLSSGHFRHWPQGDGESKVKLLWHELSVVLSNGNFKAACAQSLWRPLAPKGLRTPLGEAG